VVRSITCILALGLLAGQLPTLEAQSVEERIEDLSRQVAQLNQVILELRSEISQLRGTNAQSNSGSVVPNPAVAPQEPVVTGEVRDSSPEQRIARLEENQQLLSDRVEEQYQTKVESASRYRVKLSGIVLLNAFQNSGRVDSAEVPDLALRAGPTDTGRVFGITALQSQIGLETYGPSLAGAKTSAALQFDFLGIAPSPIYAASWGAVKLRTAAIRVDWPRTSIVAGQDVPFISPLAPTSIASLAYPAFSYSGNLWTWIPQVRLEHRVPVSERSTFTFQGGFLDPVPRGPAQPAYATRVAWSHGDTERPLTLGIGAFYSREDRGAGRTLDGWSGTADWLAPLGNRFSLSGEFYRGRGIGGLGAAQGRSVVTNGPESDPNTAIIGLNSIGGWAQLTFKATPTMEFNAAHGEDRPFRSDLLHFSQSGAGVSTPALFRNRTELFNVIYHPRTDLVLSLEYRRFRTWRIDTSENASHINLGVGVLF